MLDRYYVYEQHMGGREEVGTQAQDGYQETRASGEEIREDQETTSAGKLTG